MLVSGLLAIAARDAYKNAGWAWIKALLGIVAFEGTLLTIVGTGRKAAEQAAAAVAGQAGCDDPGGRGRCAPNGARCG